MVVIWAIMSAFGYQPHYLMSLVIHNAVALLFWLFRTFGRDWQVIRKYLLKEA